MSKVRNDSAYPLSGSARGVGISVVDWIILVGALFLIWFLVSLIFDVDAADVVSGRLDRMNLGPTGSIAPADPGDGRGG